MMKFVALIPAIAVLGEVEHSRKVHDKDERSSSVLAVHGGVPSVKKCEGVKDKTDRNFKICQDILKQAKKQQSRATIKKNGTHVIRGPDGYEFVHNLLHMTGKKTFQPFVSDQVYALFNGEIYNYESFGLNARSDGQVLLPLYEEYGASFPRVLDGEFAVAVFDYNTSRAVISTDVFGTKPLWYGFNSKKQIVVSSYESVKHGLDFDGEMIMVDPNTIIEFDLKTMEIIDKSELHSFDMRQFKNDTKDWEKAFLEAVRKRVQYAIHPVFLGLSSGYDSGLVQAALIALGGQHHSYTIHGTEDIDMLQNRWAAAGELAESNLILLGEDDLHEEYDFLSKNLEPFRYGPLRFGPQGGWVQDDPASIGMSYIFWRCRARGHLVYLSGSGADEIISDYAKDGKKLVPHSSFAGVFPDDLLEIFPWRSFFLGTQRDFLMKEELVSGAHGVEGRYPFLDKQVVQEFLWMTAEAKNSVYKRPQRDMFERIGYPYIKGEKRGFDANENIKPPGHSSSMMSTVFRDGQFHTTSNDISRPDVPHRFMGANPEIDQSTWGPFPKSCTTCNTTQDQLLHDEWRVLKNTERAFRAQEANLETKLRTVFLWQNALQDEQEQLDKNVQLVQQEFDFKSSELDIKRREQHSALFHLLVFRDSRVVTAGLQHLQDTDKSKDHFWDDRLAELPGDPTAADANFPEQVDNLSNTCNGCGKVMVVTCVTKPDQDTADFPMSKKAMFLFPLFRESSHVHVHNVCTEGERWSPQFQLEKLLAYFQELEAQQENDHEEGLFKLYYVTDGLDVIFNEMSDYLASINFHNFDDWLISLYRLSKKGIL